MKLWKVDGGDIDWWARKTRRLVLGNNYDECRKIKLAAKTINKDIFHYWYQNVQFPKGMFERF